MPVKANLFTMPPHSSLTKSIFQYANTSETASGVLNANVAMPSEKDVDTDNTVPKPPTDDHDVPLSPVASSDDDILRSYTLATDCLPNAGSQHEIWKSSMPSSAQKTAKSTFVGGMGQSIGIGQSEQYSAKKHKPKDLHMDDSQQVNCVHVCVCACVCSFKFDR